MHIVSENTEVGEESMHSQIVERNGKKTKKFTFPMLV